MVQTVIGINSNISRLSGRRNKPEVDYKKELQEIIDQVDAAKNRLAELAMEIDAEDRDTGDMDEALDALDDAIDILEDVVMDEEG
ncbi:MAG: hypothetical protein IJ820_07375 [Lachnospiraceae bacterium]|nr:hypothetical protein [Blautia sp.]MBR1900868.1 hypothetical protein [Lachnospiraceae bacterium]